MKRIVCSAMGLCLATLSLATTPPDVVNYHGVLRDSAGDPLDGSFDMVFRFFSAETLGDEILVDRHLAANAQAVEVDGGVFNVVLGEGEMLDGAGPGTYTSLTDVFAGHTDVWLEIQVGAETLAPRMRVAASAYALNASRLEGQAAGAFLDTSAADQAKDGKLVVGSTAGTGNPWGIEAYGIEGGGYFVDTDGSGVARVGWNNIGVRAEGNYAGGYFRQIPGSSEVYLAFGDFGVQSKGRFYGGFFEPDSGASHAYVGHGDSGIRAVGDGMGGQFYDGNQSGFAHVGVGDVGINGYGQSHGGYFEDSGQSGHAYLGYGDRGMEGHGNEAGGYFRDLNSSGYAYVGFGDYGIYSFGNTVGGYFKDANSSGYSFVGYGDYGIQGYGYGAGGYFQDSNGSGYAYVGNGDRGIQAYGSNAGGYFNDTNSSSYAIAGYGSYKIWGSGAVSFVQNHPEDEDKVVVYHAPESSEVGVYTRGSARLEQGRAVVALDATFPWVTNPDLGLTAHLTPRGSGCLLYVESVTTAELSVRSDDSACGVAAFDYMVWGLRIGFEESTAVQPKEQEAYIPSMQMHEEIVRAAPELAVYTAQSRFAQIAATTFGADAGDAAGAHSLLEKIHVFDPAVDRVEIEPGAVAQPEAATTSAPPQVRQVERTDTPTEFLPAELESVETPAPILPHLPVDEPVSTGDLLVVDASGKTVIAVGEADPGVLGVALEESAGPVAAVATYGVASLKVDADFGTIRRGDLLISSPTPGHAMRAYASVPGAVIAKALEPLEAGRGSIRVLITPR